MQSSTDVRLSGPEKQGQQERAGAALEMIHWPLSPSPCPTPRERGIPRTGSRVLPALGERRREQ